MRFPHQHQTPKHQKHTIGPTDYDIECAASAVARSISEDVHHHGGSRAKEGSWNVCPKCGNTAPIVGGSWLGPGHGGSCAAGGCAYCDVVDAADDWRYVVD